MSDGVTLAAGRGEESSGTPRCLRKAESARMAVHLGGGGRGTGGREREKEVGEEEEGEGEIR